MTQILKNLQIDGFRGFQNVNLSNLGQVNLIVGTNNSGKTSLLEAISIFSNPLDPLLWFQVSKRLFSLGKSFRGFLPDLEYVKWIFQNQENLSNNQEYLGKLTISASGNTPITELEARLLEIYGMAVQNYAENQNDEEENENNRLELELKGLELEIKISPYLQQIDLFDHAHKEQIETFEFWEEERFIYRKKSKPFINTNIISPAYSGSESARLSKLIIKEKDSKNEILDLMKFFDPYILDMMILSPKQYGNIYIEHQKLGLSPLDIFGDGMKKTLAIALAIQSAKDGILLIDEIETSIHISALKQVFSWLVKSCLSKNIQLFVTTHSLEAIDAIINSGTNIDDIVAFQLNNINKPMKRFSGDLLNRLRFDRGLDIR